MTIMMSYHGLMTRESRPPRTPRGHPLSQHDLRTERFIESVRGSTLPSEDTSLDHVPVCLTKGVPERFFSLIRPVIQECLVRDCTDYPSCTRNGRGITSERSGVQSRKPRVSLFYPLVSVFYPPWERGQDVRSMPSAIRTDSRFLQALQAISESIVRSVASVDRSDTLLARELQV